MANTSKHEKRIKDLFVGKCWEYLNDNFHKFTDTNKIKVALTLVQKDMPQEIEGMNLQQVVMMGEIKKGEKPLRYNIGSADTPEDTEPTR